MYAPCKHHLNYYMELYHHLKGLLLFLCSQHSPTSLRSPLPCFLSLETVLPIVEFHINGIIGKLFVTPWTAACHASLSITNSQSLLKLMSIESVMPSNHLILCHPLLLHFQSFQASGSFQMSQFFTSGGQSIGVSASASVFPMNIQD